MQEGIKLWACAAVCQDQTEREVIGLYRGGKCLLVSRPWRAPSSIPVLQFQTRRYYPVLAAIISAADFHIHDGVWFGEIAFNWRVFAALTGMTQGTIYMSLKALAADRFIHYIPATGAADATLVRVFPHNARTGVRLFQIEPSWLPGFEVEVRPRVALYEVKTATKIVEFLPLVPDVTMAAMSFAVSSAPMIMPEISIPVKRGSVVDEVLINLPGKRGSVVKELKIDVFLSRLKGVPGLDELYRLNAGIDPDIGESSSLDNGEEVNKAIADWRADGFSQRGIEVLLGKPSGVAPKPADLGSLSTWAILADAVPEEPAEELPRNQGKPGAETEESGSGTAPDRELDAAADGAGQRELSERRLSIKYVGPSSPKSGEAVLTGACGATAAPPPAAPPVASELFVMSKSERQLRQVQVDAIYKLRGERVNNARRKRMLASEVSCIETYERLAGIPFCAEDLPWLMKCLAFTSLVLVLRGIRNACRFPDNDPGRYVFTRGMKHVFNVIQKNKLLHAKARGGKKKASPVGSSRSKNVDDEMRAQREARRVGGKPQGVVSEKSEGAVAEPQEHAA